MLIEMHPLVGGCIIIIYHDSYYFHQVFNSFLVDSLPIFPQNAQNPFGKDCGF